MKIKNLLLGLFLASGLFISCGSETEGDKETKTEKKVSEKAIDEQEDEVVDENVIDQAYSESSVQSQWEDVVYQVKSGEKNNLDMYLDGSADTFSAEAWEMLDFAQPEYAKAFEAYATYEEIPAAANMPEGTKEVMVLFQNNAGGDALESAAIIYLNVQDGLIWIIGCEMAG